MVAVIKGKSNSFSNRIVQDTTMSKNASGVRPFKIYPESSKVKIQATASLKKETTSKSVPSNAGSNLPGATDIKTKSGMMMNMEKNDGSCNKSLKLNSRRKVLADISNVRNSFSRSKSRDSPKPVKSKLERIPYLQRSSLGPGVKIGNCSSSKSSMGEARTNQFQSNGNRHTSKKAGGKDMKATSAELRTSLQERKPFTTTCRTSGRNPLPPTRKSLLVLKPFNKVIASDTKKEDAEKSEKGRGKYGFPVKHKVGRNVVPQATHARSHLWRDRVSDGFIVLAPKGQAKADAGALLQKSAKPRMTATTTVVTQRKSTSKSTAGLNKSLSSAEVSSKTTKDVHAFSTCKCIASAISDEQSAQGVSSNSNSNLETSTLSRTKSVRRKSFTTSLMSRPKLLKEQGEESAREILPSIYDDRNHLEVTEYVDDIYRYYWVMEAHSQPSKNYLDNQTEISPQMRAILINWLIEVHMKFDLMEETLFLMVTLLDQYLSLVRIKKNEMQLAGLTALLLASKYEDFWHPRIMDLISISAESYTRDQILGMEQDFLKKLKFRLNAPTPYVFMLRFLKAAQLDKKFEHLAFYLIELCLVQYEAINYKPSLLCASAIYLARKTLHLTPSWTPLLAKHACYEELQIRDSAEMLLKFHKAAQTSPLKVTYEKYMRHDFSGVAAIKPLARLPI